MRLLTGIEPQALRKNEQCHQDIFNPKHTLIVKDFFSLSLRAQGSVAIN